MTILAFIILYLIVGFMGSIMERGVVGDTVFVMTAWIFCWPFLLLMFLMIALCMALVRINNKIVRATAGFNRWGKEFLESLFS